MKRKRLLCLLALVLILAMVWVLWANTAIQVNEWTIHCPSLPAAFDGFRIAQVSDLHNTSHWEAAVKALEDAQPDIIVLTGDLIDSRNTDVNAALEFARKAAAIVPCFYVTGNHESRVPKWRDLRLGLLEAGVQVLENEKCSMEKDGASIHILGLMDPDFGGDMADTLSKLTAQSEGFTVLLSHRPERFALYAECGVDLVFSGHAHGGQVRIPFLGGLIAPHQGWFPEYDAGLFERDGTRMLVSRGGGNSIIPLRINNRPEIVIAVLNR